MIRHPVPGPADAVGWPRERGESRVVSVGGRESPTGVPGEGAEVLNCQQLLRQASRFELIAGGGDAGEGA